MDWQNEYGLYLISAIVWLWGYYLTWTSDCALPARLQEDRFVRVPTVIWLLCLMASSKNAPPRVMAASGFLIQVATLSGVALLSGLTYVGMWTLVPRLFAALIFVFLELLLLGRIIGLIEYSPKRKSAKADVSGPLR